MVTICPLYLYCTIIFHSPSKVPLAWPKMRMHCFCIANERVLADFSPEPMDTVGYPDGCCIDMNNNLWVACFGGSKVVHIDTKTGRDQGCCTNTNDNYWVTFYSKAVHYDSKTGRDEGCCTDTSDKLWVAQSLSGVFRDHQGRTPLYFDE